MEKALYDTYLAILKEELVPAMGCTEPIAVAYAAALAARALGCPAEQAEVAASANIIKNVKSVPQASWQAMRTRSWKCSAP